MRKARNKREGVCRDAIWAFIMHHDALRFERSPMTESE